VAVEQAHLLDETTRTGFLELLTQIRARTDEILLVLERGERQDMSDMGAEEWLPLITDFVCLGRISSGDEYRLYLGRRIYSLFPIRSKDDGIMLSRVVDTIVTVGATAFLEVLGAARQGGAAGYVYFVPPFADGLSLLSQDSAKALAFEHAEERLVVDDPAVVHAVSAQGFPPAKCISIDAFLKELAGQPL
jgi:hypothetical protein